MKTSSIFTDEEERRINDEVEKLTKLRREEMIKEEIRSRFFAQTGYPATT